MRLVAAALVALASSAFAGTGANDNTDPKELDPPPRATPIIAPDDTRTHGLTAVDFTDLALSTYRIVAPLDHGVDAFEAQVAGGLPDFTTRELRDVLSPYSNYQLRVRGTWFHTNDGWLGGPMTFAIQRYWPIDPIAISPLVFAHWGLEVAAATPWISGHSVEPPEAVRIVHGVDTELAENGWSLRPLSGYLRADFLACRSFYVELGGAPEAFVRAQGPTEYDMRAHVAGGWSFACGNDAAALLPKIVLEYRARVQLHAGDEDVAYFNSLALAFQLDEGRFAFQALAATEPGSDMRDYWMVGVRVQVGLKKGEPQ